MRQDFWRWLWREPLLHFLLLGGLVFSADAMLHPRPPDQRQTIALGQADIDHIRGLYARQWGRDPRPEEMQSLIDQYVRSEILFREGSALGLAADDPVVRNRVAEKMEILLQNSGTIAQPTEAEMNAYLAAHAAAYSVPERFVFRQIYFSATTRGDHAAADAQAALRAITTAPQVGDPFMLGDEIGPRSPDELAQDFGGDFAAALSTLPAGRWMGPLQSAFGWHLVQLTERTPARLSTLAEVRGRVHDDLMAERLRAATDGAYAAVGSRYSVKIAPGAGAAPGPAMATSARVLP